jgi:hypothetical protein
LINHHAFAGLYNHFTAIRISHYNLTICAGSNPVSLVETHALLRTGLINLTGSLHLPNSRDRVSGCHRPGLTNRRILETANRVDGRLARFTLIRVANRQQTVFGQRYRATIRINDFGPTASSRHHPIASI